MVIIIEHYVLLPTFFGDNIGFTVLRQDRLLSEARAIVPCWRPHLLTQRAPNATLRCFPASHVRDALPDLYSCTAHTAGTGTYQRADAPESSTTVPRFVVWRRHSAWQLKQGKFMRLEFYRYFPVANVRYYKRCGHQQHIKK